jgi:hypothetical protein
MVLLAGGAGKLISPKAAALAVVSLSGNALSYDSAESLVLSVSSLEIVAAVGLFLPTCRVPASLLAGLMSIAFLLLATVRHLSGVAGNCGCFGSLITVESTWAQAMIAGVLLASSLLVFITEYTPSGTGRTGSCNAQIN